MKLVVERQDAASSPLPTRILPPGVSATEAPTTLNVATSPIPSSTSTPSATVQNSPSSTPSSNPSSGLPLKTLIPAIVVPIAVVAIVAPVLLYFFLTRHDRQRSKSAMSSRVSSRTFQDHVPPEPRVETKSPALRDYSSETANSKASDIMNFNLGSAVEKPLPPTKARRSPENHYDMNDRLHHPEWPGRPATAERSMRPPTADRPVRPSTADRPYRPVRHDRGVGSYDRPERPSRPADTFAYEVKRSAGNSPVGGASSSPTNTSPTNGMGPSIGQAISRYSDIHYDNPPPEGLLPPNPHPPMPTRPQYVNRTSIQDLTEENMRIGRLATDSRASFGLRGRDIDEVSEVSADDRVTQKEGKKAVDELSDVSSVYDDDTRSKADQGKSLLGNSGARQSGPLR